MRQGLDQLMPRGVVDTTIQQALLAVPREAFVPDAYQAFVGDDTPLPIDRHASLWRLSDYGLCLNALAVQPGERIVCMGGNAGYLPVVLASLGADVMVYESNEQVVTRLRTVFDAFEVSCAITQWEQHTVPSTGSYDALVSCCALPSFPDHWTSWLHKDGRMLVTVAYNAQVHQVQYYVPHQPMQAILETQAVWFGGEKPDAFVF